MDQLMTQLLLPDFRASSTIRRTVLKYLWTLLLLLGLTNSHGTVFSRLVYRDKRY
jgi:hypothetical protein